MSTEATAHDTQAPTSSRGRGRGGRGGGLAPRGKTTTGRAAPKAQTAKLGPTRLLEVEWVKDASLKGDSFVFTVGSGQPGDQQWTFHRPIGETALSERDWVATPSRDIGYLLQRKESEALLTWKRQAELAKRQAVLAAQLGRKLAGPDSKEEVWTFDGSPAIQPTIQTCITAAKAAGANESTWLDYADPAVRAQEQRFKASLKSQAIPEEWLRANPKPHHETRGGPLGDQPQRAVPFLKGLTTAAANDKVTRVAIGIETTDSTGTGSSSIVPTPTTAYGDGGANTARPGLPGPAASDSTKGPVRSKLATRRKPSGDDSTQGETPSGE